jgi:hypothetical protein
MYRRRFLGVVLLIFTIAIACELPSKVTPSPNPPGLVDTLAARTLEALHQSASPTPKSPIPTNGPATLTPSIAPPVNTATLFPSITPLPSLTPMFATISPTLPISLTESPDATDQGILTPTPGGGLPTKTSSPCNIAQFISDVTIPDGMKLPTGLPFTKVWRIKNVGSCNWDDSYLVVYTSGDRMKGKTTPLQKKVRPGETIDIFVNLVVPDSEGNYKGNWMLQIGPTKFGGGSGGTRPFFVQIEAIPNSNNIAYNFALDFCAARWQSDSGDLICPGTTSDPEGFAIMLHNAELETRQENEPVLWMQPYNEVNGWISGTYPAIDIQAGDRFQADIGCLAGYKKCNINFELWYRISNAPKKKIDTWQEFYDNHLTRIDLDLSPIAGNKVSFILVVYANSNPDQAAGFWLMPQIRRP